LDLRLDKSNDVSQAMILLKRAGSTDGHDGAAYLIGPPGAPIGYIIVTFGWSIGIGGMDGFKDKLYVRSDVRSRGIASEVLLSLPRALAGARLKALQLKV